MSQVSDNFHKAVVEIEEAVVAEEAAEETEVEEVAEEVMSLEYHDMIFRILSDFSSGRGGARGGSRGGAKVVIEQHRHKGVFIAKGKEDVLVTKNMLPGESVYGEKRISVDVSHLHFHFPSFFRMIF
jgi:hypothetical protein